MAICETLAPTNNIADAFLHDATHAPQPMHVAELIASSALTFGTRTVLPSGAFPTLTEMYPPEAMIRSNADRSTTRSRTTGKARARHGSMTMVSWLWKRRMWSWQVAVLQSGPWAWPLIIRQHVPQ